MDFEYTPEQESFRHKIRTWLDANLPKDLCVDDAQDERIAPNREVFERRRAWQAKLHSAGYAGLSWPKEYGGHAATLIEQVIWDEEYSRARAPVLPNYFGLGLCGPTLMNWGTEAQKKRFLPRILGADDIWCQGYSEPGAGSDLAGLSTRAADMGDYFLVNGQKVWTSGAQYADWMFMLARTDPEAPKHRGISYLLLDMKSPGIVVRPLVLMNGHSHFNEVFFDNVQVPKENLVGPLNEGWKVAMTTLSYERAFAGGGLKTLGNFYVDLTRDTLYLLMPIAIVATTNAIAALGATVHRTPTAMLERTSATPLTASISPKPAPRLSAGRYVAAVADSTVSQKPM